MPLTIAVMKRKNFDILTYIGFIDIRFEPVNRMPAVETIGDPANVPLKYKEYLVEGSTVRYVRYSFGVIFSQKIVIGDKAFWLHVFDLEQSVTLKPVTNALLVSVNYLMRGRLDCVVNDERLLITENKYQLYALADSISYEATLDKGLTIDFHTTVPEHMITDMQKAYDDVTLNKLYELSFKGMFTQDLFSIRSEAKKHIRNILSYKRASTHQEILARKATWEQHLAALFRIYLYDRNNYLAKKELESADRLHISDLPKYIEKHLPDYSDSPQDPLQLKNILKKFKLREREFNAAIQLEFETTWRGLINIVRMEKAVKLIRKTPQLSLADIAAQLGYSYHTHFTRAFKNYYGQTPQQYRANII